MMWMKVERDPSTAGATVLRHRLRAGWSQRELAARAGVSVRMLRDLEHGRITRPQEASLLRISTALGLALTDLTGVRPPARAGDELWIGILGPLVVRRGREPVELSAPMRAHLLGLLALHADQVVSTSDIVDVL